MKRLISPGIMLVIFSFFISFISDAQEIQWQKTFGGSGFEYNSSLIQTHDNGFLLGTSSWSSASGNKTGNNWDTTGSSPDYWIIRLDTTGNILWQKTIGGIRRDDVSEIEETTDGGFIIGGSSSSDSSGDKTENGCNPYYSYGDMWIIKLDSMGNIQWQNTITGMFSDALYTITQTLDGGYICGGGSHSNISCDKTENNLFTHTGTSDFWVLKLDSSGNIEWQNTIGGGQWSSEDCTSLCQTIDGGYICGGSSSGTWPGNDKSEQTLGGYDFWIVKLDSAGNIQWENTIGGNSHDDLKVIKQLSDGNYICGGSSSSGISSDKTDASFGSSDYWIFKLDSGGNIIWQVTLGGDQSDDLAYINPTSDQGFICGGTSQSGISGVKTETNQGGSDCWILKLDSVGNIQWQNTIGGSGGDCLSRVFPLNNGNDFICAGYSDSGISGDKTDSSFGSTDNWIFKLNNQFNFITGNAFIDINSNGIHDAIESDVPFLKINLINSTGFSFSRKNGFYSVPVLDTGFFSTTPANNLSYYTTTPALHTANFTGINQTDSLNDFAFQPTGVFNDLSVTISPLSRFRSGFDAGYIISYGNYGTTNLTGDIIFYPDSNITFVWSSLTPSIVTPDSIVWSTGMLVPYQTGNIMVTVHVFAGLPIGTLIYPTTKIEPFLNDANPGSNFNAWELYTVASYDPNEILVSEDTLTTTMISASSYLDYIIRFQNTGNDTAFTVKLLNPIDTNRLDLNTLEVVSYSHPVDMDYIPWERNMVFTFENILLPDSGTNELMSHGFIHYRIKPKTALMQGDSITNFAAIYFDLNSPVITNNALTKIVLPNIYTYQAVVACNEFVSPSGNYTWTYSGLYLDTIPLLPGLDSVITVNLTLNKTFSTFSVSDCESYFAPGGHYTWTTSGTYIDTILNATGCDSIMTINLSINKSFSTINVAECENYVSPSGSYIWPTAGIYSDTIPNAAGCDSIMTINLSINKSYSTINIDECEGYTSPGGNYYWTVSGVYSDTISNGAGCDSIMTINLSIISSYLTINPHACGSYTSPSGNHTWTTNGTYQDTVTNTTGCDVIMTINLTVDTIDVSITVNSNSLFANASGADYQWIYCDSILIPGETNQAFIAGANGSYAVIVTQNGCIDTSACYAVMNVGISEPGYSDKLFVFPNPAVNTITILFNQFSYEGYHLIMTDPTGRIVYRQSDDVIHKKEQKKTVNISSLAQGIYFIQLDNGTHHFVAKLVKQ